MALSAPSNQRLSFTYPCEREATISFAPSAEFSDTKVQNVVTRSTDKNDSRPCCETGVDTSKRDQLCFDLSVHPIQLGLGMFFRLESR
jgi:hypothetical protein